MRVSKRFFVYGAAAAQLLAATGAAALPIGFGVNQRDREYDEIRSDNFIVYHDRRVPAEGAQTLNALEAARPFVESWMKVKRSTPLPVITSAVTTNASFANFITDVLEIQTAGTGDHTLAWHEYTHSTMYRHFDGLFGPATSILNLPFMPPWFMEGLAETTSVSVGSDVTAGIERYQALTGDWPTYDRLHSLYAKYGFFERGYGTAGAMVTYLLKRGDAAKLPTLLADFRAAAMPWWYPYTIFKMPMNAAMDDFAGISGEDFYERYKKDAKAFWTSYSQDPLLIQRPGTRRGFPSVYGMRSDGKEIRHFAAVDDDLTDASVVFDAKTGFATDLKKGPKAMDDFEGYARLYNKGLQAGVHFEKVDDEDWSRLHAVAGKKKLDYFRPGSIFGLWEAPKNLVFLEQTLSDTRLCVSPKPGQAGEVSCPVAATIPRALRALGARVVQNGVNVVKEIWLVESEEKLRGNLYTVKVFDAATLKIVRTFAPTEARPLSVAFAGQDIYLLSAGRNSRELRRIDEAGACLAQTSVKDHVTAAFGLGDGSLVLGLYHGDNHDLLKLKKGALKEKGCALDEGNTSPLQAAIRMGPKTDLRAALRAADLWVRPDGSHGTIERFRPLAQKDDDALAKVDDALPIEQLIKDPPLDQDAPPAAVHAMRASKPRKYRARPLFMVPWIGGDDALGTQLGAVSVPLMDHLQNETVRATFLYGLASHFPNTEVAFTETRYRPTITAAAYRQQTYNGNLLVGRTVQSSYQDEKGVRAGSDWDFQALGGSLGVGVGTKFANLKPYIGPKNIKHGTLIEPSLSLGLTETFGEYAFANSLYGRVAPGAVNKNFDYNELGAGTSLSRGLFWSSRLSLGLEGSRTRGTKMRELREYYQPLKTFIPGSGGGYNQNNFTFLDKDSTIFSTRFGNNQARAKANWTIPVIPDIDKALWFIYMESLDFTAFYNYGVAWQNTVPRRGWDHLIGANGYNLDLLLERYGVHVNFGLGTGHVVGEKWAVYGKFGFDAFL